MRKNRLLKESDHQLVFDAYQYIANMRVTIEPKKIKPSSDLKRHRAWLEEQRSWVIKNYVPIMDRLANWMQDFPESASNKKCGARKAGRAGRKSKLKKLK